MKAKRWIQLGVISVCALCISAAASAQINLFGRYYRDQKTATVVVATPDLERLARDGQVPLTEEQVVELALRNNLDVNVERHNFLLSEWTIEEREAIYDPTYILDLNWNRQNTPTASVLQGGTSVTDILTVFNTGYRQNFSTGTSFEVNFSGSRTSTSSFFASLVPAINTNVEVLFRQNLLEGFGRVLPDYEIEISRNDLQITEAEFRRRAQEMIFEVLDRYWELQFATQDIEVNEKSLQLAETVLEQNRARFEVGTAARLEVVQSEAEVASRREELISSRFQHRLVQDQLIRLISNYEDPRRFPGNILPATRAYTPPNISEPFERLQAMAFELRPEMEQNELDVSNQQIRLDLSRNQLRPTLDLVAGYQQFGLGGRRVIRDFSQGFVDAPLLEIVPGGLEDSLSQLFSSDFYGYVVGFSFNLPIGNNEARAQNAQAKIALDRARLQQESLKQQISLEIRDALTQIEMNEERLQASQAAVRFAQERLEGEEARFEVGMGTTRELIEAQRDLLQAESVLLRAQTDLIKSHRSLDRALGRSFERYNIRLADALSTNVQR